MNEIKRCNSVIDRFCDFSCSILLSIITCQSNGENRQYHTQEFLMVLIFFDYI